MANKDGKDGEKRARRKLSKTQAQLQVAQDKRRLATLKGEREVEQARIRSARRLDRATRSVEKRAAAVARAESEVTVFTEAASRQPDSQASSTSAEGDQKEAGPAEPPDAQEAQSSGDGMPASTDTW
jgi:Mg-chelatase subunit ChlI